MCAAFVFFLKKHRYWDKTTANFNTALFSSEYRSNTAMHLNIVSVVLYSINNIFNNCNFFNFDIPISCALL